MRVCVCVCVCVRARARAYVCARASVCVNTMNDMVLDVITH